MRFSYAEALCDPTHYLPLARAVEDAGWDTFIVPDSICYPEVSDSKYPYTPDGNREFLEDKPFIEPFSLIPAMVAVTSRLRFTTFVVKLPIRQPVLVAKSVASVAVMTQGRFGFGVGLSPWPEDFAVTGTEWTTRGKRMDEMIAIVRGLLRGEFFEFQGAHYRVPSIKICPVPSAPVPVLIGGHTEPALRRAARLGDGWISAGSTEEVLVDQIRRLRRHREDAGRADEPFRIHVRAPQGATADGVRHLAELGVTDVVMRFQDTYTVHPDDDALGVRLDALRRYADDVIVAVRG